MATDDALDENAGRSNASAVLTAAELTNASDPSAAIPVLPVSPGTDTGLNNVGGTTALADSAIGGERPPSTAPAGPRLGASPPGPYNDDPATGGDGASTAGRIDLTSLDLPSDTADDAPEAPATLITKPDEIKPSRMPASARLAGPVASDEDPNADPGAVPLADVRMSTDSISVASAGPPPSGTVADALYTVGSPSSHTAPVTTAPDARSAAPALPLPRVAEETSFADQNHPNIVRGIRSELVPGGGAMRLRLDPPQLGDLVVQVHMRDGLMTASFETSTDHATRLLSHSLGQLKDALESQGVQVDKLQVQQVPRGESKDTGGGTTGSGPDARRDSDAADAHGARQEQQRREMLRRMWRRLAGGGDPLDLVA